MNHTTLEKPRHCYERNDNGTYGSKEPTDRSLPCGSGNLVL